MDINDKIFYPDEMLLVGKPSEKQKEIAENAIEFLQNVDVVMSAEKRFEMIGEDDGYKQRVFFSVR